MTQPASPMVLIVDDEDAVGQFIRSLLEEQGYAAHVVHNGREALAWLGEREAALIISDVMMPRVGGVQLALRLWEDAKLKAVPLVLMSALGPPAGDFPPNVRATIGKPFRAEPLLAAVAEILDGAAGRPPAGDQ
ncbi:MAG TPA: response regulator [Herpetosiphonaceae bacterium]